MSVPEVGAAETLDEQVASLIAYAEERVPTLDPDDPDDDILPMTRLSTTKGAIMVVHPCGSDAEAAVVWRDGLPEMAAEMSARSFATAETTWMLPDGVEIKDADGNFRKPRDAEDRVEAIVVLGSDGVRVSLARRRFARPPGRPPEWTEEWARHELERDALTGKYDVLIRQLWLMRLARAGRVWLSSRPEDWWTPERVEAMGFMAGHLHEAEGRDDLRKAAEEHHDRLIAGQRVLGIIADDEPSEDVRAIADDPGLWEIPVGPEEYL